MYLRKNETQILQYLIETKTNTSVKELSKRFNVSERSVYYYLDNIDLYLKKLNIIDCFSKKNRVFLNINESQTNIILKSLRISDSNKYAYSENKRMNYVISRLLTSKKSITISKLADELNVSRTSLNYAMKKIYSWLENNEIKVIKKNNYGVSIECDENSYRKCASTLIKSEGDYFYNVISKSTNNIAIPEYYNCLINVNDFSKINKILQFIQNRLNIVLFDFSYVNLFIHIAIAIERIRNNCYIDMSDYKKEYLKSTIIFNDIYKVVELIEQEFNIKYTENEICYLALHIMASTNVNNQTYESDKYIKKIALDIVHSVEKYLDVKIGVNKIEDLINNLAIHLRPAIIRMGNNMRIVNPLLDNIKSKYSFLFDSTRKSCDKICDLYMLKRFSDDEVAYITMHIGATLESDFISKKKIIKVATLCLNGIATSKLLSTRLKNEFAEIEIEKELTLSDLNNVNELDISYIVSTVDVYVDTPIPIIKVSPILNEKDIEKIRSIMNIDYYPNSNILKGDLESINDTIEKIITIFERNNTIKDIESIKKELNNYFVTKIINEQHGKRLSDYLNEDYIEIVDSVHNWEEAIKKSGEILVRNKCINYKYIDEIIDAVYELGPYIVISKGVAIPHARKISGVYKTSLSLLVIKNGVNFGNEYNDPVYCVFCLAIEKNDNSEFASCFKDIGLIVSNTRNFKRIINYDSPEKISKLINRICK